MNSLRKLLVFTIAVCLCLTACGGETPATEPPATAPTAPVEVQDYAAGVQLDMSSGTAKTEATVKSFVDGDTVHFYVPDHVIGESVLQARFLAINTPESTGKIEEWGKKASAFTKEKLSGAQSIILESETTGWDLDSTGGRYLVWVWYQPAGSDTYRNLNIEILQNGLAIANSSAQNQYGQTCMAAIDQAKAQKLNVYSSQPDPDFYYGEAIELTLKELRTNIESYSGMKVAFEGVITTDNRNTVYVESYDPETELYYGISVYYGFNLNGKGMEILRTGNLVRIVGSVQYYEAGDSWQISDLSYRIMEPDDPDNIQLISQGHEPAWTLTDPTIFAEGSVRLDTENGVVEMPYAQLALGSTIRMQNLTVVEVETEEAESSRGAMTLTCKADDTTIVIRTDVLRDENGQVITADAYLGKTIDVKGIVDCFHGTYQIKVFTTANITIH